MCVTEVTEDRLWKAKGDMGGAIAFLVVFGSFSSLNEFFHWTGPDTFITHISLFSSMMAANNIASAYVKIKKHAKEMREYEP